MRTAADITIKITRTGAVTVRVEKEKADVRRQVIKAVRPTTQTRTDDGTVTIIEHEASNN